MEYVETNMKNTALSSDQCLNRIIEYFENAKKTVENELLVDNVRTENEQAEEANKKTKFNAEE